MKKILIGAIVVSVLGMFIVSCSAAKTYSNGATTYVCWEITTSDTDMQDVLILAGFEEESCTSTNSIGTCSSVDNILYGDMTYVYYDDYSEVAAENLCDGLSGTWE